MSTLNYEFQQLSFVFNPSRDPFVCWKSLLTKRMAHEQPKLVYTPIDIDIPRISTTNMVDFGEG